MPLSAHCLIVEKGTWKLPYNRTIFAESYTSTFTDRMGSWTAKDQTGLITSKSTKLTLPIIKCTTLFYIVSRFNTLRIASKRYIEAYYDPTLVPNGYWDQTLDHFPWSIPPSSRSFWLAFWLELYMVILEVQSVQ